MKNKIGDIIKIKNNSGEILNGNFLIVRSKNEKPTREQLTNITIKHNILNLTELLDGRKIDDTDYVVVEILPYPFPVRVEKINIHCIFEKNIL